MELGINGSANEVSAFVGRIRILLFILISGPLSGQSPIPENLQVTEIAPQDILATRSVVIHDFEFTDAEINEIQKAFQQIGIDAVAYFDTDVVLAGKDITKAFSEYFIERQIRYIIFFEKGMSGFIFTALLFDQSPRLFDPAQPAWRESDVKLPDLLRRIFQDSWRNQKKQNYLINEFPERDIVISPFKGSRQEFYAIDLKVDNLAVPKFGNEAMDRELEEFFKANYPLKYKITEAGMAEEELRRQGFLYVLCYVHTRGSAAREILGYDISRPESTYASIAFPAGQLQLKTIPSGTGIYKFYFRHITNGNVFLGTKWDADITWLDALRNHVLGFKTEIKMN